MILQTAYYKWLLAIAFLVQLPLIVCVNHVPIALKACVEQGGSICPPNAACTDVWILAADSNNCCANACQSATQTCEEQGGEICDASHSCSGLWITATNSVRCCSSTCKTGFNVLLEANGATFLDGCATYFETGIPPEPWPNSIDGDTQGWDGTTTAEAGTVYATFKLAAHTNPVSEFRLLCDTGVGFLERCVEDFRLQVSTDGQTFQTVLQNVTGPAGGGLKSFTISPPVQADYVKFLADSTYASPDWYQIGEMELY